MTNSAIAALDIFVAPKTLFTNFKSVKKSSWLALLLLLLVTCITNFLFFNNMSPEWILEQQMLQAGDISPAEEEQMRSFLSQTVEHTGTMAAIFSSIFVVFFNAVLAGYFTLAAKSAGSVSKQHSYGDWFSFSIWTQMPMLVNLIGFFVLFSTAATSDLPLSLVNYASVNQLFLGLSSTDDYFLWAESLNLFYLWSVIIAAIGLQRLLDMSVTKSYVLSLFPYLVVFLLWAVLV